VTAAAGRAGRGPREAKAPRRGGGDAGAAGYQTFHNVTCIACGVLCDDLEVDVEPGEAGDAVVAVRMPQPCAIGGEFFAGAHRGAPAPRVGGRPASLAACLDAAAEVLARADHPLLYGFASSAVPAQRLGVALAERLGAVIDTPTSVEHGTTLQAMQMVGDATCTLGEVKNRADVVVFWGANPVGAHPRHVYRYSVFPPGLLVRGRGDRFVAVVDVRRTATAELADLFLQIEPGFDYEALTALRVLLRGERVDAPRVAGVEVGRWAALLDRLKAARFASLHWGLGLTTTRGEYHNVEAILALARDLSAVTKAAASPMRGHAYVGGNVVGADTVLAWHSGYPYAVAYARRYPRYNPREFRAWELLARGEVDAALFVSGDPAARLPRPGREGLGRVPLVAVTAVDGLTTRLARVVIPTARTGVQAAGTAYRMDRLPLPLRAVARSPWPADDEVLAALAARLGPPPAGASR
jgi:formylmethanofuran dehydrogenase subunit B